MSAIKDSCNRLCTCLLFCIWKGSISAFSGSIKNHFCAFCIYCWYFFQCRERICFFKWDNEINHRFKHCFNKCLVDFGLWLIRTILSGIISIVIDWRNEFLKCLVSLAMMMSCDVSFWALSWHWTMIYFVFSLSLMTVLCSLVE